MNDQLKSLLNAHRFGVNYAKRLVNDIAEDQLCAQPGGCTPMNHAAWTLGHLVSADGFTISVMGGQYASTLANPNELYGQKSSPSGERSRYPSKSELLAALEHSTAAVEAAALNFDMNRWQEPFPVEGMRKSFPTVGDGLTFLLTTHQATHLGQLSSWRRAHGLPAV